MKIELIERDIRDREQALRSCEYSMLYLRQENEKKNKEVIDMLNNEVFFLQDQLSYYNSVLNFLKAEEGPCDEVPPRI